MSQRLTLESLVLWGGGEEGVGSLKIAALEQQLCETWCRAPRVKINQKTSLKSLNTACMRAIGLDSHRIQDICDTSACLALTHGLGVVDYLFFHFSLDQPCEPPTQARAPSCHLLGGRPPLSSRHVAATTNHPLTSRGLTRWILAGACGSIPCRWLAERVPIINH